MSRSPVRESSHVVILVSRPPGDVPGVALVKGQGSASPTTEQLSCPVCGITLFQSDFDDESGDDYYCPYCTTGRRPSRFDQLSAIVADDGAGS